MKLVKTKSDSIDLGADGKGEAWAKEAIEAITGTIPIMTSISKKTESAHFSFIGLARHASLAESLIYKSNRFRTTSEVFRGAMYIGMSCLYHLTKDEGTVEQKARADQIYRTIQVMESINHNKQIIDAVLLAAKDIIDCKEAEVIELEEMEEKMGMLLEALPGELARVARDKIKRLVKGDSILDIAETRIQRNVAKR